MVLSQKLLDYSEHLKIENGQRLHDSLGQQLTGIQLLCNPLADVMKEENKSCGDLADQLRRNSAELHNHVRRISRLLFPVKIAEVGLISALHELASCIHEIKDIDFEIKQSVRLSQITEELSLQAYRICQESSIHAIEVLNATMIKISVEESSADYLFKIEHNGQLPPSDQPSDSIELIKYRLQQIGGSIAMKRAMNGLTVAHYTIPKQAA